MIGAVEGYIKLRRRAGFKMASAECLLQSFACFAAKRRETLIRMQTAIDWAALGPSVSQRDARLKEVCRFARHMRAEDHRHELPPANYFGYRKKRPVPHIYSLSEINRLIEAALRPKGDWRYDLKPTPLCWRCWLRPACAYPRHLDCFIPMSQLTGC
jgi:integrase/recombinase XerD